MKWQPINEGTPKDKTVLVRHKTLGIIEATQLSTMCETEWQKMHPWDSPADNENYIYTGDLTHWMPLPEPPTEGE